ncbi:MAG: hypothetical protein WCJ63_05825 [Actinomycetes bacterium]
MKGLEPSTFCMASIVGRIGEGWICWPNKGFAEMTSAQIGPD